MNLFDEYKNLYSHEIEFCDRLNKRITNSLGILTIIGTGEIIIWKECLKSEINILLFLLCFISIQSFLITSFKFYKSYTGYKYAYYPIEETKKFIDSTYKIVKNSKKDITIAENHVLKGLQENYIKCAIINRKQNIKKANAHRELNKWMIISLITIFISYTFGMILKII